MSEPDQDDTGGLYVGWVELNRLVAPRIGRDRFRALIKGKVERSGFPPFNEEWGGFYWPKVRLWLDSANGVGSHGAVEHVQDGPETFDAAPRKKAGLQARPPRPAVLDREPGLPRPEGVSRHLHSVGSGGER